MQDGVLRIVNRYLGQTPLAIRPLGGGFYGRVFGVSLPHRPSAVAVKAYLFGGLHRREAAQLEILSAHSLLGMPQVIAAHDGDDEVPFDALIMEYLEGINAGKVHDLPATARERIGDQVIENLLGYHRVTHAEGFGEIGGPYADDWRDWYKVKAESNFRKAIGLYERGQIERKVLDIAEEAFDQFDLIFSESIASACLIHGDYNMWNVLLNDEATEAVGVIDPFNCCWADSEMDLYQLNNANGRAFALLERYRSRVSPSDNFAVKSAFYELFSEIMHFYDADVDASKSALPDQAARLRRAMIAFGR